MGARTPCTTTSMNNGGFPWFETEKEIALTRIRNYICTSIFTPRSACARLSVRPPFRKHPTKHAGARVPIPAFHFLIWLSRGRPSSSLVRFSRIRSVMRSMMAVDCHETCGVMNTLGAVHSG